MRAYTWCASTAGGTNIEGRDVSRVIVKSHKQPKRWMRILVGHKMIKEIKFPEREEAPLINPEILESYGP